MESNGFGPDCALAISEALRVNETLTVLDLGVSDQPIEESSEFIIMFLKRVIGLGQEWNLLRVP